MDLTLIRSLIAVADHGAITEAADALHLSQPALSRRIRQIEDQIGAELLRRSRRGVALTEAGRQVVREGRELVERYERMRERVRAELRLDTGTVRVGGGATAVAFLMPAAIARFSAEHPGVVFQLKEAGSREIEREVLDERIEVGVVTLPIHFPELEVTPLRDDRIALVGGAHHPLAGRRRIGLDMLQGLSLVGFEAGSAIRQLIDNALREAGVEMKVVMELRSIAAILHMVATTGNLAFVSELGVEHGDPRIRRLPVSGLDIVRKLAIIEKRGRPPSAAAAAFAETLLDTGSAARMPADQRSVARTMTDPSS